MPNYATQVTLFPVSNVIADATINTFSFSAVDDTDLPDIHTALIARYNAFTGQFPALVRQNNHLIKSYDRADPEPRAPRLETQWNFTAAPSGAPAPPEVAHCLSFQANPVSGIPQSRRRGRIYLGPLDVAAIAADGRPTSGLMSSTTSFGQGLLDASDAAADWEWCVWSTVNGAPYIVTNGWCDDEFDTQRRRGRLATSRQIFN